eukprot:Seg3180.4 transcript_id=Seg3180.4/GoldUCD/mRNA.D3Y31 product="Zinc finger protein 208" protein_id=Seg3180.4/GoldUCD/D3Y31
MTLTESPADTYTFQPTPENYSENTETRERHSTREVVYTTLSSSSSGSASSKIPLNDPGRANLEKKAVAGNLPFPCNETGCGKRFGRRDNLKRHMLIHTGETQKCPQVGYARVFRDKCVLRRHVKCAHEQKEPISCSEEGCDKKFHTTTAKKRHMMEIHSKFVHQCPICSKGFLFKHLLEGHMTLHTGMKNYACDKCKKELSFKHNLATHVKNKSCSKSVDLKDVHFFCEEVGCGKGYGDRRSLSRHIVSAHTTIVFKCNKCKKVFSYASSLSRHKVNCS